jgi:hypothetical protein
LAQASSCVQQLASAHWLHGSFPTFASTEHEVASLPVEDASLDVEVSDVLPVSMAVASGMAPESSEALLSSVEDAVVVHADVPTRLANAATQASFFIIIAPSCVGRCEWRSGAPRER